jgi:hypothetical protein
MFVHTHAPLPDSAVPACIQSNHAAWQFSNPNVDRSAPPPPSRKKAVKKSPAKKPRKQA